MSPVPHPSSGAPEVLIAILTDLSIDHRCWKWANSLRAAGYRPVIYCDRPMHPLGAAWSGIEVRELTGESHLRRFFPVFAVFLLRLLPILLRTKSRVWVAMDAPPLFWLAFWGRLRGRTVVYDSHELFLETPLVLSRPTRRLFWTLWENGGFASIRRCTTVSPIILDRLKQRHPRVAFRLLPNMPSGVLSGLEAKDAPGKDGRPVRLVFQGGLRVHTGLQELFEALRTRPDFTLDVYGGGPEQNALQEAAQRSGVAGRVFFHGSVPFEELPRAMAAADFGVHLMQPATGSFALTWANKIFDYARAGIPMLLSDNPAHRILLAEYPVGVVADAFSPRAIGEGLDRLRADREAHAEACLAARERWRWETYFPHAMELLEAP